MAALVRVMQAVLSWVSWQHASRKVLYSSKMYMILLKLDVYIESALRFTFQPCFLRFRVFCKGSGSMLIEYGNVIFYIYMAL